MVGRRRVRQRFGGRGRRESKSGWLGATNRASLRHRLHQLPVCLLPSRVGRV